MEENHLQIFLCNVLLLVKNALSSSSSCNHADKMWGFFPPVALKKCHFGCKSLENPHKVIMEGFTVSASGDIQKPLIQPMLHSLVLLDTSSGEVVDKSKAKPGL